MNTELDQILKNPSYSQEQQRAAGDLQRGVQKIPTETLNLVSGISDAKLQYESKEMINTSQKNWKDFWDDKDAMLDRQQSVAQTLEQRNKIKKQRQKLRDKVWSDNAPLLSKAIAMRDECLKRPALNEEADNLKNIISKFYDMKDWPR